MKKVLLAASLTLALAACGTDEAQTNELTNENEATQQVNETTAGAEEVVDARLTEPTENTECFMCNMKVYMKDHEMGVFAAQAIREDGSVVFYDDIGCLLNDEYVNQIENEKYVRDFNKLNWLNVEEAYIVKTDLKSPMNWGYIFFKNEEDANAYVEENHMAAITPIAQVRDEAIERHKKKQAHSHSSEGNGMDMNEEDGSEEGHGHE